MTTANILSQLGSAGVSTGFKNRLFNGAMQIWQRGTTGFSGLGYTADRWTIAYGTTPTASQSSDVPSTAFPYSLSFSGSGFTTIAQRIESVNCRDLVGQTVTVSFWAKQTAGSGFGVALYYPTVTDNYAATTLINSFSPTLTSSWVQYTATFTALPSQAAQGLQLAFNGGSGSCTFYITGVQLEVGTTATNFDYRSYGTELALCQRYYEVGRSGAGSRTGDNAAVAAIAYKVTKRTTSPTLATSPAQTVITSDDSDAIVYQTFGGAGNNSNFTFTSSAEL